MEYFGQLIAFGAASGIVYGAWIAIAQRDLKALVAYSSISHLGFIALWIFALNGEGIEGSVLQMFNHGITTGALFLFVGLIYERTQTRIIADYGGLMKMVPVYGILLCIFTLSSMAVPGTNAFVGELLVLAGAFGANKAVGAVAVAGAVLSAAYLWGFSRQVALGPAVAMGGPGMWDLNAREMAGTLPLVVFVFWVGLYPMPFIDILHVSVEHLLAQTMGH